MASITTGLPTRDASKDFTCWKIVALHLDSWHDMVCLI
jgi:hypothetical protein